MFSVSAPRHLARSLQQHMLRPSASSAMPARSLTVMLRARPLMSNKNGLSMLGVQTNRASAPHSLHTSASPLARKSVWGSRYSEVDTGRQHEHVREQQRQQQYEYEHENKYTQGLNGTTSWPYVSGGCSLLAITGLAYYAMNREETFTHDEMWDEVAKARIHGTYLRLGLTMAGSAAVAVMATRVIPVRTVFGWPMLIGSFLGTLGSMFAAQSTSLTEAQRDQALACFTLFEGLSFAGLTLVYPAPMITQAGIATASLVGGMSLIGAVAPSEQVLKMQGPLMLGAFGVLGASVGRVFFPGPILNTLAVYGGLGVFSLMLLNDTSRLVKAAKHEEVFSPQRHVIKIYLDAAIVFQNLLQILSSSNRKK